MSIVLFRMSICLHLPARIQILQHLCRAKTQRPSKRLRDPRVKSGQARPARPRDDDDDDKPAWNNGARIRIFVVNCAPAGRPPQEEIKMNDNDDIIVLTFRLLFSHISLSVLLFQQYRWYSFIDLLLFNVLGRKALINTN